VLIEYLFSGGAVANQPVAKGTLVGAVFIIQAIDEMYFATNAIINAAKIFT